MEGYRYDTSRSLWVGAGGGTATSQARAAALGKAMHALLEGWYKGQPVDWSSFPGQIANSGSHLLPHPDRCHTVQTEIAIGKVPLPPGDRVDAPTTALSVGGVLWAGFRDLVVSAPAEFIRLGIDAPDGWLLVDYKSSASIDKYALTDAALLDDPQANLYAIDVCKAFGLTRIPGQWSYFETKAVRRAAASRAMFELSRAHDVIGPCAELARELDTLTRSEDAPQNTDACNDYGDPNKINCRFHVSKGGKCNARRSIAQILNARIPEKKGDKHMAIDPKVAANFEKIRAANAAKAEAAKTAVAAGATMPDTMALAADTTEPTTTSTEAVVAALAVSKGIAPPARVGRPPKAKGAVPTAGSVAATVAELSAELTERQAVLTVAEASVAEIVDMLRTVIA